MLLTELQALTDDVATRLGAATVLEDEEQRMVAYSSQTQPIDDVRRDSGRTSLRSRWRRRATPGC